MDIEKETGDLVSKVRSSCLTSDAWRAAKSALQSAYNQGQDDVDLLRKENERLRDALLRIEGWGMTYSPFDPARAIASIANEAISHKETEEQG